MLVRTHDKDKQTHGGTCPVIAAANKCHLEVVRFLCDVGADKDKAMRDGTTPFIIAAQHGNLEVVQFLLDASVPNID